MASLISRLTYSAMTASLLAAPLAVQAQDTIATQPTPPASTAPTPSSAAPTPAAPAQPTPRALDDDRYTPPSASPGVTEVAPSVNGPPPGAATAVPTTGVAPAPVPTESTPLPPAAAPPEAQAAPPAATPAKRSRHAASHPTTEVKLSVQGKVVADDEAAQTVKVEKGDTVNLIAERLKVSKDELIKLNKLKKPYALDVDQTLKLPPPKAYVIESGDTLMGVSRRFGTSPATLAQLTGIGVNARLHLGQKIVLPADAHDGGPIKTVVAGAEEAPSAEPPSAPPPVAPTPVAPPPATPPVSAPPVAQPTPTPAPVDQEPSAPPAREVARPAYTPTPEPSPEVRISVQGRVIEDRQKSREMRVGPGDTVNVISDRLLTDKDELIKLNHLKKPYELNLGEILKIPTPKAYVTEGGDTLPEIARRFDTNAAVLAEINDMDENPHLRPGAKIALPAGVHDGGPIHTTVAPMRPSHHYEDFDNSAGRPMPPSRLSPPPAYSGPPVVDQTPMPSEADIIAAGRGRFTWPITGQLLSAYGPKPGGQRNDGIDLAAPLGTPVMAAAEGDVVYAGNQVPGFGNLVLIKHTDGWVTAYAYLSRVEVKIKDHVSKGQEIGQVGQTGGVDQPQLHFEVRLQPTPKDKARPIDPTLVLPSQ